MPKQTRPKYLFLLCLALAWIFDFLFWDKPWGVSFPIFIGSLLSLGLWQAKRLGLRPSRPVWVLAGLAVAFSLVSVFRTEPFTLFVTRTAAVGLLALFAAAFLDRGWLTYNFRDLLAKIIGLLPLGLLAARDIPVEDQGRRKAKSGGFAPVFRGLLLAVPVLLVLGSLLASADAFFSDWLQDLLSFLDFENISEYIFRGFYILVIAVLAFAVYLYAFFKSKTKTSTLEVSPFLGFTEAVTVLTSVLALFLAFVVIQFRYFFGGAANILNGPAGLTYAEYARRGFAELVLVAVASLVFFILLSAITKRSKSQQSWFSGLGVGLFLLVSVILVSAFQRLFLYEEAYGFTRMRTIPHVFMIWLGLLLLALVVLEVLQRQRNFAIAVLFAMIGFAATFPLINMDAFIAKVNLDRGFAFSSSDRIDSVYLATLSADAMPGLAAGYERAIAQSHSELAATLALAISCNAEVNGGYEPRPAWQSWNYSYVRAAAIWAEAKQNSAFPDISPEGGVVLANGEIHYCVPFWD